MTPAFIADLTPTAVSGWFNVLIGFCGYALAALSWLGLRRVRRWRAWFLDGLPTPRGMVLWDAALAMLPLLFVSGGLSRQIGGMEALVGGLGWEVARALSNGFAAGVLIAAVRAFARAVGGLGEKPE